MSTSDTPGTPGTPGTARTPGTPGTDRPSATTATTAGHTAASGPSAREQYDAARSGIAVRRLERDFVSVTGPEADAYLQGQCSQDVVGLGPSSAVDALLLSPQGKIDALVRVSRFGDGFVIDTDPGFGPTVVERLQRFRLRTRVDIGTLDGWACVALRGTRARDAVVGSPSLTLPVEWPGLVGLDLLGSAPPSLSEWVGEQAVVCGEGAWEAVRIEAGVPAGDRDEVAGAIPAEVGIVERTVSFTKGCYTGQELVARLDARGSKVARRLRGVVIEGGGYDDLPPVGTMLVTTDGEHEVGRLTSVAWSFGLEAVVGLAMVHRRVEPPGPVRLRPGDGDAEVRPLPLRT